MDQPQAAYTCGCATVRPAHHIFGQSYPQLVRLVIEAPGWAGVFCAPREIVVERMCKEDEVCVSVCVIVGVFGRA
jgi:hypothetical protein